MYVQAQLVSRPSKDQLSARIAHPPELRAAYVSFLGGLKSRQLIGPELLSFNIDTSCAFRQFSGLILDVGISLLQAGDCITLGQSRKIMVIF